MTKWTIEYEGDAFARFFSGLGNYEQAVLTAAIEHVLAVHGIDICSGEWGKPLSGGLYEFRVRKSLHAIFTEANDPCPPTWSSLTEWCSSVSSAPFMETRSCCYPAATTRRRIPPTNVSSAKSRRHARSTNSGSAPNARSTNSLDCVCAKAHTGGERRHHVENLQRPRRPRESRVV